MERPIRSIVDKPFATPNIGVQSAQPESQSVSSTTTPAATTPAASNMAPAHAAARSQGRSLGEAFNRVLGNGRDFETDQGFREAIAQGKERAENRAALESDLVQDEYFCRQWYDQGIAAQNRIIAKRKDEK